MLTVRLYRYHPEQDALPQMETHEVEERFRKARVLDVLAHREQQDPARTYRRAGREGVCGSDGMRITGKNGVACVTSVEEVLGGGDTLSLRPLSGMPVIRVLVVDQTLLYLQF